MTPGSILFLVAIRGFILSCIAIIVRIMSIATGLLAVTWHRIALGCSMGTVSSLLSTDLGSKSEAQRTHPL
jgi:hypothetical protein